MNQESQQAADVRATWPTNTCRHCHLPIYFSGGWWYHRNGLRKCSGMEGKRAAEPTKRQRK